MFLLLLACSLPESTFMREYAQYDVSCDVVTCEEADEVQVYANGHMSCDWWCTDVKDHIEKVSMSVWFSINYDDCWYELNMTVNEHQCPELE